MALNLRTGPEQADGPEPAPPPVRARPRLRTLATPATAVLSWGNRHRAGLGRVRRTAVLLLVAVAGLWLGASLAPPTTTAIGPLQMELRVVPTLHGDIRVQLPPIGEVTFPTHVAPLSVEARVVSVDPDGARALVQNPRDLLYVQRDAPDVLRHALIGAGLTTLATALLVSFLLALLVYRAWRRALLVTGTALGVALATLGIGGATFNSDAFAAPRFTGLLTRAPILAGNAGSLMERLESYRSGLADVVQNVTSVYAGSDRLGGSTVTSADVVTVLHVSDIHLNPSGFDLIDRLVRQFKVDVVADTGDVTTWGTPAEATTLQRIGRMPVPYVFIRGNHDSAQIQQAVSNYSNAVVLDGDVREVKGVVFAGVGDPVFTPNSSPPNLPSPQNTPTPTGGGPGTVEPQLSPGPGAQPGGGRDQVVVTELGAAADQQLRANQRLAGDIDQWQVQHPGRAVDLAMVHEPFGLDPLLGRVPTLLAGHVHARDVRVDRSGTRIMIEGSTGGAGKTAGGLRLLAGEQPGSLEATLLYLARSGSEQGRVVAYDEVTVGGAGLTSVSLERHLVRPEDQRALTPQVTTTTSATSTGTTSTSATSTSAGRTGSTSSARNSITTGTSAVTGASAVTTGLGGRPPPPTGSPAVTGVTGLPTRRLSTP
jgi:predicted MPP superfamily phosphohydrolase